MNLYSCRYEDEWHCLVIAETRNKARYAFAKEFPNYDFEPDYPLTRARLLEKDVDYIPGLHDADEPNPDKQYYCFGEANCQCETCKGRREGISE